MVRSSLCYSLADLSGSVSVMCVRRAAVLLEQLEDLGASECVQVCILLQICISVYLYV